MKTIFLKMFIVLIIATTFSIYQAQAQTRLSGRDTTGCANCVSMVNNTAGSGTTWIQCADYCRGLGEGGYTDWRVPTLDECINYRTNGAIAAPGGGWVGGYIWTSTPWNARVEGGTRGNSNWVIFNESNGGYDHMTNLTYSTNCSCRCVR
jgi:hypothetical protein